MRITTSRLFALLAMMALLLSGVFLFAQETTGGLTGTIKDATGALVSGAHVVVTGSSLAGTKEQDTDSGGYYRFSNLPPGTYAISVSAKGFKTTKREGLALEVGHLPSVDIVLEVGAAAEVVEVTGAAPVIDVTTNHTMTNITEDVINEVPHGRSFQSVIQFAPAASNEPLGGSIGTSMGSGTGGQSPGSSGNGQSFGYSVAGGSDSENRYLVEGQETADIIGGFSHTQVPFDFIQEVQVKSSGVEAEYGGALGGVVNVVMKKGSNAIHGSVFTQFENQGLDGSPNAQTRYNPLDLGTQNLLDPSAQLYQPKKDKTSDVFPGFTVGGPILKDRIWFFLSFNPELNRDARTINYSQSTAAGLQGLGSVPYSANTNTYYTTARIDGTVSDKIRVFGSWLYQLQRQSGESLPGADSTFGFNPNATGPFGTTALCRSDPYCAGFDNVTNTIPVIAFGHNLGFTAPNIVTNFGADITLTPRLVATTRFGYFFQNYHDFGYPTTGVTDFWQLNGNGAADVNGNPIPASTGLVQGSGYFNAPQDLNYTVLNANKRVQFDQDIAFFKSGWGGTHNFRFGYQLNRSSNQINQRWNQPYVQIFPGASGVYYAAGSTGATNCGALVTTYGAQYGGPIYYNPPDPTPQDGDCTGTYGTAVVQDYGSLGYAVSYNHGLFAQDSWTIGHGVTINAGIRVEKEYLPGESANLTETLPAHPIDFGWGDKVAPRVGVAWDVFKDGKMKVFGSYGVFVDNMKLNLAISSFGGQYWNNCAYAMMDPNSLALLNPVRDSTGHYCSPTGGSTGEANLQPAPPAGSVIFLENANERSTEGVTSGLKPYRQHESVFGVDYQLSKNVAFEARWDRRRLDRVIEDAALFSPTGQEIFTIINPGYGQNAINATCATAGVGPTGPYDACPPDPKGARSYDGLELRVTRTHAQHWFGMASYTYSHFRGNYTGLSSTDISDGGGGRNAPNNSRAFDETYFSFNAYGSSSSGLLPTDRPNKFKGYAYYELGEGKHSTTDFGLFQFAYQGSPVSSFIDVGYSVIPGNFFAVYTEGRGKWVNVTGTTGNLTIGNSYVRRTPWFTQSDFNLTQNYRISETKVLSFSATIPNALNQHAITAYNEQIDSQQFASFLQPGGLPFYYGGQAYSLYEHPYPWKTMVNNPAFTSSPNGIIPDSKYGQPYLYQLSRNIRLRVGFTF